MSVLFANIYIITFLVLSSLFLFFGLEFVVTKEDNDSQNIRITGKIVGAILLFVSLMFLLSRAELYGNVSSGGVVTPTSPHEAPAVDTPPENTLHPAPPPVQSGTDKTIDEHNKSLEDFERNK